MKTPCRVNEVLRNEEMKQLQYREKIAGVFAS